MTETFYFNTGVRPWWHIPPVKVKPPNEVRDGTLQIPMECEDVPPGAIFAFAAPSQDLNPHDVYHVSEIKGAGELSGQYAYFKVYNAKPSDG